MAKINIEDAEDLREETAAQTEEPAEEPEEGSAGESTDQAAEGSGEEAAEVDEETAGEGSEEEAGEEAEEECCDEPGEETGDSTDAAEDKTADPEDGTGRHSDNTDAPGGLKGFFKNKKKKDKRDQQIEELTDRVRRQMAEFDNFRKRTEKEKSAMYEVGAKSVIEKILPVVDSFERGLSGKNEDEDPFTEGMFKIYRQLMTTLESMDVKPIEAVGQTFDPELHNAVMHVDDESVGDNVVVEELQKGYKYRDSVVRYSMVKVAN